MRRVLGLMLGLLAGMAVAQGEAKMPTLKEGDRVLIIGDSVTAGSTAAHGFTTLVQQAWNEQRPEMKVTFSGQGHWAAPSKKLRDAIPKVIASKTPPNVVIIYFGLNDANQKVPQADYAANLEFAITELKKAGIAPVICTPSVWRWMGRTTEVAATARQTAAAAGVPVIDLYQAFDAYLRTVKTVGEKESPSLDGLATTVDPTADGVHLGAIGNRLVATEILKAIGLKAEWKSFPVTVVLGNPNRNLGYGPRGKGKITMEPQKVTYEKGERIKLTVVPEEGHTFVEWRGSIEAKEATTEFVVDGPAFIQAVVVPPGATTKGK